MRAEEWRPWRDGAYEVSDLGRVRRAKPGRNTWVGLVLKKIVMKSGYHQVRPVVNGRNVTVYVHAMVTECFIGPRPSGTEVNHRDGIKKNNRRSNLEYVTRLENMAHAVRLDIATRGERHGMAKLTGVQVRAIRERRANGERGVDLAREYGISQTAICNIHKRKRWSRERGTT